MRETLKKFLNNLKVDFFVLFTFFYIWFSTASLQEYNMIIENTNSNKKKRAVDMFKESLKFQATEKEANKQQATERQEKAQSWSETGRSALVKAQTQTREEASSQTKNGI